MHGQRKIPIIPEGACSRTPLESNLNIWVLLIDIIQVSQDDIALGLIKPNNTIGHRPVDPKRLPSCCGMNADQWVLTLHVPRPGLRVATLQIRVSRSIDGGLAINELAKLGRELLVCCVSACPERISSYSWNGVIVEMCHPSRLSFMNQVAVPSRCATWSTEAGWCLGGLQCRPHHGYAGDARDLRHLWLLE